MYECTVTRVATPDLLKKPSAGGFAMIGCLLSGEAKSRKCRGMFEMNSLENITTSLEKALVSTSRTYASPKFDGTRCPEE